MELVHFGGADISTGLDRGRERAHQPGKQRDCADMSDRLYTERERISHAPCQLHQLVNREPTGAHQLLVEGRGTLRRQCLDGSQRVCACVCMYVCTWRDRRTLRVMVLVSGRIDRMGWPGVSGF